MPRIGASINALFPFGAGSILPAAPVAARLGDGSARSKAVRPL